MATTAKRWTLDELGRMPEDGNRYEVIDGALFVTPAPSPEHEMILARLSELLVPFVAARGLGVVFRPRAVLRVAGSEAEPDLFIASRGPRQGCGWEDVPPPLLVVEVLSPTTRRRDLMAKRDFYLSVGVAEYWVVDPDDRSVRRIRAGRPDVVESGAFTWDQGGGVEIALR